MDDQSILRDEYNILDNTLLFTRYFFVMVFDLVR